MDTKTDAWLVGGPRDGSAHNADGAALLELDIDGMVHRYIRTTKRHDGNTTVYTYDGMVAPGGGEPGVEDPAARVGAPRTDTERPGQP